VAPAFRLDNRLVEKMSKVVRVLISLQDNVAAASAVTPIRPPFGNEFFAPETDTPPSALSGLRKNFDAIDKHDARHCHREPTVSSRRPCLEAPRSCSTTMTPPWWVLSTRPFRWQQATLGPSNLVAIHLLFIV